MKLQTKITMPAFSWQTGYLKPTLFIGSCFTENMGNQMAALKFQVDINPFGILYNPASIARGIQILLNHTTCSKQDLICHNSVFHSFDHHSRFSHSDPEQVINNINQRIDTSASFLKTAEFLMITFGTAWVYQYKPTSKIVANCHKLPDKMFNRFRLSPEMITQEYAKLINTLLDVNPFIKVIFTVSPIRHWKDGAIENQRSKAVLLLAIEQIIKFFGEERCNYFPAYEIMMDELRDYRFYNDDMIHPSSMAVNYLWEKFQESLIDPDSIKISEEIKKIKGLMNHRPFNMFSSIHLKFLKQSLEKTYELEKKIPYLDMEIEKNHFISNIRTVEAAETLK